MRERIAGETFVISIGNAFDGLRLFGPFDDMEIAYQYADENRLEEWHCVLIETPEAA